MVPREKSVEEKFESIKRNCLPFDVKVKKFRRKDRYYLKFENKDSSGGLWIDNHWKGFYEFTKAQIMPYFPDASLTHCNGGIVTYFIDTIFGFLKK